MKIWLVANTDWYLYRFRLQWARFLQQQGMEVVFVSPPGPFVAHLSQEGFRHLGWDVGRRSTNPVRELRALLALRRGYLHEAPDLVHLHTMKPVLYGTLAARGLATNIVASVTGRGYLFLGQDPRAAVLRFLVSRFFPWALGRADAVIFENPSDRDFFLAQGLLPQRGRHQGRIVVVPGVGVDTAYYHPLPEPPERPLAVAFVGRLLFDKGIGVYVEAIRALRERGVDVKAIVAGAPDEGNPASVQERVIRQWQEEGLIEWWGWVTDVRQVFAHAHIVVLPSLGEGLPTVLLEAAACARPLVATDVPGCRDVVLHGENGLLVPPNDAQALADALQELVDEPQRRREMGARGRALVEERFSLGHIFRLTWEVYQSVLDG